MVLKSKSKSITVNSWWSGKTARVRPPSQRVRASARNVEEHGLGLRLGRRCCAAERESESSFAVKRSDFVARSRTGERQLAGVRSAGDSKDVMPAPRTSDQCSRSGRVWGASTCSGHLCPADACWRCGSRVRVRLCGVSEEREFFIDNLLVRIHFIIVMIRWTGLAPWEFEFPFPGSLTSTFRRQDVGAGCGWRDAGECPAPAGAAVCRDDRYRQHSLTGTDNTAISLTGTAIA